jgi:putative protease
MCRLAYDLTDKTGKVIKQGQHLLSLRDMNRIDRLAELADAGISSFKIEGRLKDVNYVKNIVAAYRIALDQVIAQSEGRYCRASVGRSEFTFTPEPDKSFNRGFTDYFLNGRPAPGVRMGNHATPKWVGTEVGTVLTASPQVITARLNTTLANGDGIGYFDKQGQFTGFRLNKVDGRKLFPASPVDIEPGTTLYRNNDKQWEDKMQGKTATRTIAVNFTLRNIDSKRIALDAEDQRGNRITATIDSDFAEANTPQEANRQRNLAKLGATIYRLDQLTDLLVNRFVAASVITELRRRATDLLDSAQRATYKYDRRRQSQLADNTFDGLTLTYHDNVSNRLAFDFYKSHGAKIKEKAIEVDAPSRYKDVVVMTTRYCLRRELGACLKTPQAKQLPNDLQLRAPAGIFRLEFDCRNCEMHVIRQGEKQNK